MTVVEPRRRRWWWWVMLAIAALAVATAVWAWWTGQMLTVSDRCSCAAAVQVTPTPRTPGDVGLAR